MLISDAKARDQALDPTQSFIVQAPAGSGKTELLTQRYLKLLSYVEQAPEEVVAITFTQKAAAEMQERILHSLQYAQNLPEPNEAHKKLTWQLANQALKRGNKLDWRIIDNPKRIRVMTIDALCLSISKSAPLISELGAQPSITEDATHLYSDAINTLYALKNNPQIQSSLQILLYHMDNRVAYLNELLGFMLQKRDQWLTHLVSHREDQSKLKYHLEMTLQQIAYNTLSQLKNSLPEEIKNRLIELAQAAAPSILKLENTQLHPLAEMNHADLFNVDQLYLWQAVAKWLLTTNNTWRSTVNKNQGFEPKNPYKKTMKQLLSELNDYPDLLQALIEVLSCPPIQYNDNQWQVIDALITLLPSLVACLKVVMQQHGEVDFLETTIAALRALGSDEQPTDLALYLDYQIHHLLIDEFQDTSTIQYHFFEKLISQWTIQDNRSLFLVGDPMQSIYRFRNAEVSLFLYAKKAGMANVNLTFLQLTANFRSNKTIVDWFNLAFAEIMPKQDNMATGAIEYSAATATNDTTGLVQYYSTESPSILADEVINIINTLPKTESIAILVRSRSQLGGIIAALQDHQLPFSAIDIAPLRDCPEVIDLYQLTRAMLHYDDKIAWLSLLRAPFCGLTLKDLHHISHSAKSMTLSYCVTLPEVQQQLSADGQIRLKHVLTAIAPLKKQIGRQSLHYQIQKTWQRLQADKIYQEPHQRANCQRFFDLLLTLENTSTGTIDRRQLELELNKLYANTSNPNTQIQIMTIHKSKGLEFDHVILPYLDKKAANDTSQLLQWLEQTSGSNQNTTQLLLAPIKQASESQDKIYHYIQKIEKKKLAMESSRLFYVACTRAKQSLHLLAKIERDPRDTNQFNAPSKSAQLNLLWPQFQHHFIENLTEHKLDATQEATLPATNNKLKRLKTTAILSLPALVSSKPPIMNPPLSETLFQLNTTTDIATFTGTLIHNELYRIATTGYQNWNPERLDKQRGSWRRQCLQANITCNDSIQHILTTTFDALKQTITDPTGQWILNQDHPIALSEMPLEHLVDDTVKLSIIDRFIVENDTAWIIDFKTGAPHNETNEAQFIEQQVDHHSPQLQRYQQVISELYTYPVKTALYFPRCHTRWVEINLK